MENIRKILKIKTSSQIEKKIIIIYSQSVLLKKKSLLKSFIGLSCKMKMVKFYLRTKKLKVFGRVFGHFLDFKNIIVEMNI